MQASLWMCFSGMNSGDHIFVICSLLLPLCIGLVYSSDTVRTMLDSQEVARLARFLRKLLEDVQEDTTRNTRRIKDAIGISKQIETMAKNVRADEGSYKRSRLTLLEDLPAYSR